VPDASATLPWCFQDEATLWSASLLHRIKAGEDAIVPAHWPLEILNGLVVGCKRGRVVESRVDQFLQDLAGLPFLSSLRSAGVIGRDYSLLQLPIGSLSTMPRTWSWPNAPACRSLL